MNDIDLGTTVFLASDNFLVYGKIGLIMVDAVPDGSISTVVQNDGGVGILSIQWDSDEPTAHYARPGMKINGIGDHVSISIGEKGEADDQ